MAGVSLGPPNLTPSESVVSSNPWKPIAIALTLLLAVVLIAAALLATDVMKLGFSLL